MLGIFHSHGCDNRVINIMLLGNCKYPMRFCKIATILLLSIKVDLFTLFNDFLIIIKIKHPSTLKENTLIILQQQSSLFGRSYCYARSHFKVIVSLIAHEARYTIIPNYIHFRLVS
jgi:hypothetical protein